MALSEYLVEVVVKEVRTYRVFAESKDVAEDLALDLSIDGEPAVNVDPIDGAPYVHDSREVSE
jgi:hypothetical protein